MIDLIKNIKLSLIQWVGIMGAAVIGCLVAALKVQGSRLHKAQLDLIQQKWDATAIKNAASTKAARAHWMKAYAAYKDAGGRV